ncbi:NAD(P)/FAD-dependent oxidoreductase [Oceanobacillus timonensis]|uniref:NAD(P)/FAD-dependent oxidoreductase n=1 Tax=Oceanobacillus timonensis TaxID=1926285 RepID=UPI0015C4D6D6|nr:FAD-dependent oxidoreductase [Oceanobacillus timonensis]
MKSNVTIVGAGPAGLSAAIDLAKTGISVVVIDEYYRPGGRLLGQLYEDRKAPPEERHWDGKKRAGELAQEAEKLGVTMLCGVTSWTVSDRWHIKLSGSEVQSLTSDALLLATGAAEKALPIPGWTLPGVFSIGAAQTFTNVHNVAIGQRVLVVGADPLALSVVMEMKQAGIDVAGVVLPPASSMVNKHLSSPVESVERLGEAADLAPNPLLRMMGRLATGKLSGLATRALSLNLLKIEGVPAYMRKAAVRIEGDKQVESVTLQPVTVDGEPNGHTEKIDVDTVCLSAGLYPLVDLAQVAHCPIVDIPELGGTVPLHDSDLSTPVSGLFIAGNITGIEGAKVAIAQGKLAAASIAESLDQKPLLPKKDAMRDVDEARARSPIHFLPNIAKGRQKMRQYWEEHQNEKGVLS